MTDIKTQRPANPGQASTAQAAPIVPEGSPPPAIEGATPGPTPSPVLADPEGKATEKKVEVLLKFDYWPEEGDRQAAGSKLSVPRSKAKQLISQGKAEIPMEEL